MDRCIDSMIGRFFFHLVSGNTRVADRVGIETSEDTVMSDAVFQAIAERWPGTSDPGVWIGWMVEVTDGEGRVLRTVSLDACA
jgi:hypothetical protein